MKVSYENVAMLISEICEQRVEGCGMSNSSGGLQSHRLILIALSSSRLILSRHNSRAFADFHETHCASIESIVSYEVLLEPGTPLAHDASFIAPRFQVDWVGDVAGENRERGQNQSQQLADVRLADRPQPRRNRNSNHIV
jgi:hypothetical protein